MNVGKTSDAAIRKVLMVGVDPSFQNRIEPLFSRRHFDADLVPTSQAAIHLIQVIAFDVLVLAFPMGDPPLASMLADIRRPGSPCRRSAVILLAEPDRLAEVEKYVESASGGFVRVLSSEAEDEEVQGLIATLLREAPRLSVRIPIRLEVQLEGGSALVMSQTENVSLGGMLVRVQRKLPADVTVSFQLLIPGERKRILGSGQVVRVVEDFRGRARAVGVRFVDFEGEGAPLLQSYLVRRSKSEQ